LALPQCLEHILEHTFDLPDNRHIHPYILGDGCRIHVHMNNRGIRAELGDFTGNAVIKPGTDGNQHIRLMHGHIGFISTMHTQHTHILLV